MATRTDAYPDVAIPPGEYLAEEIEARGISQKELARRMGRPSPGSRRWTSPTHALLDVRSSVEALRAAPPAARCAVSPPHSSLTPSHRPPIATGCRSWRWTRPTPADGVGAGGGSPSTSPADSAATAMRPQLLLSAGEARDTARSDEAGCTRRDQRIAKGELPRSGPLTRLAWQQRRATTGASTLGMRRPHGRTPDPLHAQAFNTVRDAADRTTIYRTRNGSGSRLPRIPAPNGRPPGRTSSATTTPAEPTPATLSRSSSPANTRCWVSNSRGWSAASIPLSDAPTVAGPC